MAAFSVTRVPPFWTKSRMALTPSAREAGAVLGRGIAAARLALRLPRASMAATTAAARRARPVQTRHLRGSPVIVAVLSLGITRTSYFSLRLPSLISGSKIEV